MVGEQLIDFASQTASLAEGKNAESVCVISVILLIGVTPFLRAFFLFRFRDLREAHISQIRQNRFSNMK